MRNVQNLELSPIYLISKELVKLPNFHFVTSSIAPLSPEDS